MLASDNFFAQMVGYKDFDQFTQLSNYRPLPSEWFVVITDIEGSTQAIQQGKYKEVNSVSTASMIAVLNVFSPLELPYVFGGDGATLCIPPTNLDSVKAALAASRELADKSFGLNLRVGLVPVTDIEANACQILVAKYQPSDHFTQAMFQGDGLSYAESLVKKRMVENPYLLEEGIVPEANFDGFECRWKETKGAHEEMVALMVKSLDQSVEIGQSLYADILKKIDQIYGRDNNSHPLRPGNLSLSLTPDKLSIESRIRTFSQGGVGYFRYLVKLLFLSLAGKCLMAKGVKRDSVDWGEYKNQFIANTDYRKFDETLRIIICGNEEQRKQLTIYLSDLYKNRRITFGIHRSTTSIVTCMVRNYDKSHTHFLDVSNGGYAMAAKQMKQQLAEL